MEEKIALINGRIFDREEVYLKHALLMEGDRIQGVVPKETVPEGYRQVDVNQANICPGLIDLQIYGAGDDLFSAELTPVSLDRIEKRLLQQGCTSFMLTLATNTVAVFKDAIAVFKESRPKVALGLHLEGPFLNPLKRGAHPKELIIPATHSCIQDLLQDADGVVKMMTIAPECVDKECIEALLDNNILLSAGHSMATCQEGVEGFEAGIKAATHLWNAMSPFHHRDVGLPGAVFTHPKAVASIIVDGVHVDFAAVKLSKQLMGERLFLITDAVATCNKGIYRHRLEGDHYVLEDGTLSGSALSLLKAVKNCIEKVDISLDEAIRMATLYPSRLIGRDDIGSFRIGAKANILVFNADFEVESVYFEGSRVV